jgi:hypothetical protein
VICAPGDPRISLPHLIHGSTAGPADCAILQCSMVNNWPTAIKADGDAMEFLDLVSRTEVTEAHRTLSVLTHNPVGVINSHSHRNVKFTCTPEVRGIWGVGDALLGFTDWDSAHVRQELEMLFPSDAERALRLAEEVQKKLVSAMWDGFRIQE